MHLSARYPPHVHRVITSTPAHANRMLTGPCNPMSAPLFTSSGCRQRTSGLSSNHSIFWCTLCLAPAGRSTCCLRSSTRCSPPTPATLRSSCSAGSPCSLQCTQCWSCLRHIRYGPFSIVFGRSHGYAYCADLVWLLSMGSFHRPFYDVSDSPSSYPFSGTEPCLKKTPSKSGRVPDAEQII